jgi:hypothetical protein
MENLYIFVNRYWLKRLFYCQLNQFNDKFKQLGLGYTEILPLSA